MKNKGQSDLAFILHSRPYRESSVLLDLLTLEHGRIAVVARSARGVRSRFQGVLQAFTPLMVAWMGATELANLTMAEMNGLPLTLRSSLLINGLYLNELLMRVLQRFDPHPTIYKLYQTVLNSLHHEHDPQPALRLFEKNLLIELGYALTLDNEANSNKAIVATQFYRYDPQHGAIAVNERYADLPSVFLGKNLLALHENNFQTTEYLRDAKRLMRIVFKPILGNRPLKSRELYLKSVPPLPRGSFEHLSTSVAGEGKQIKNKDT